MTVKSFFRVELLVLLGHPIERALPRYLLTRTRSGDCGGVQRQVVWNCQIPVLGLVGKQDQLEAHPASCAESCSERRK